jgi:hypothetical protein
MRELLVDVLAVADLAEVDQPVLAVRHAVTSFTGMLTSPKLIAPLHMARGTTSSAAMSSRLAVPPPSGRQAPTTTSRRSANGSLIQSAERAPGR